MELTAECGADEELRGLNWDALQSTRLKLDKSSARGSFRDKMSKALNQVSTLAEFSAVLKKGEGGSTAGMTGLTYNLMKIRTDEVIKAVYNLLVIQ